MYSWILANNASFNTNSHLCFATIDSKAVDNDLHPGSKDQISDITNNDSGKMKKVYPPAIFFYSFDPKFEYKFRKLGLKY